MQRRKSNPRQRASIIGLAVFTAIGASASFDRARGAEVNATFTNTDANNSWADANNWNPATEPNNNGGNNFLVTIPAAPGAANVNADITIDGLTVASSGVVNILNNEELAIGSGSSSTTTNNGTITVNSGLGGNSTDLRFSSAGVNLLTGTGSVVLTESGALSAVNTATGATLTVDTYQTIKGSGTINAAMTNNGTIDATSGTMALATNAMSNSSIMEATGGATLNVSGITVTNTGTVEATGTASIVLLSNATISGGTLSSGTGGVIATAGSSTIGSLTNSASINVVNDTVLNVTGNLTDNGTITVNSGQGGNVTQLTVAGGTISGTGARLF